MEDFTGDSPTIASTHSGAGGVVAGRYRVRARLGRGATKDVYLAYDERLDREVALAIVVGAGNDVARARVAREAQVTGRLGDHPNVITVYDTGEVDGVPYLVLRAMGGGSLAAALKRERPTVAEAVRLGRQIAAALAHAHANDVVHRDVKPDNVWLAADGSAALGDFGIAHVAGADRLTAEGVVVGTVRYLAPEQIRGEPAVAASDLYALGVTLYELVTGRPPFHADDPAHVLTQHLTTAPLAPSEHEPTVPPALDELILALLDKQPERRPPGAAAVGAALAAIAATDPQPGRTGGTGGAGGTGGTGASAGGGARSPPERPHPRGRDRVAPARRGARRTGGPRRSRGAAQRVRSLRRRRRAPRRDGRALPRRRARRVLRVDGVLRRRRAARRPRRRRAARRARRPADGPRVRRGVRRRRGARDDGDHRSGDQRGRTAGRARRAGRDPARRGHPRRPGRAGRGRRRSRRAGPWRGCARSRRRCCARPPRRSSGARRSSRSCTRRSTGPAPIASASSSP